MRKAYISHFYCIYNIHFFYLVSWSLFSFFDKRKNMFTKRKHQPKKPNEKRIPRPAAKSWKNPHFVSSHHYYVFNHLHDAKLDIKVSLPRVWDWILETGRISFFLRYFKHGDILKIWIIGPSSSISHCHNSHWGSVSQYHCKQDPIHNLRNSTQRSQISLYVEHTYSVHLNKPMQHTSISNINNMCPAHRKSYHNIRTTTSCVENQRNALPALEC